VVVTVARLFLDRMKAMSSVAREMSAFGAFATARDSQVCLVGGDDDVQCGGS
jgi:hypothetical protein